MDQYAPLFVFLVVLAVFNLIILVVAIVFARRAVNFIKLAKQVAEFEQNLPIAVNARIIKKAEDEIVQLINKYNQEFGQLTLDQVRAMAEAYNGQISKFGEFLRAQQTEVTNRTEQLVEQNITSAGAEIDNYKKAKFIQIEEEVGNLVGRVTKEVLNKTISIEDHEDLVHKALERAKIDGIFNKSAIDKKAEESDNGRG